MLAPWKKSYDKPRHILQIGDITLSAKVYKIKAMVFPVVTYRCESWTIKKAECQRIDAFKLWCWRRLLDCKIKTVNPKGNQPWIFIRIDAEAEASIFWPPDVKRWLTGKDRCWERLKAGGERDDRGRDGCIASLTQWTWVWANSRKQWKTGKPDMLQSMGSQRVGHDWATEQQKKGNWYRIYT